VVPIRVPETVFDTISEVLQACDQREQFTSWRGQMDLGSQLLIEARACSGIGSNRAAPPHSCELNYL